MSQHAFLDAFAPRFLHLAPLAGFATLLAHPQTRDFAITNACVQALLFVPLAQLPALRTGIMSWVDLAWPCGLVALGVQTKLNAAASANSWRTSLAASMYLFQGGRMALGAIALVRAGHMTRELPRYLFQFKRWERDWGITRGSWAFTLMMQKEIFMQAIANAGCLVVPGALMARGAVKGGLRPLEVAGALLWAMFYAFEHASDLQKLGFMQRCKREGLKGACCDVGFWSLSRHPNYFGEWGVWLSLAVVAIPSMLDFVRGGGGGGEEGDGGGGGDGDGDGERDGDGGAAVLIKDGRSSSEGAAAEERGLVGRTRRTGRTGAMELLRKLALPCVLGASPVSMYLCLTWWTGAIPAEYWSAQKRPGCVEEKKKAGGERVRVGGWCMNPTL